MRQFKIANLFLTLSFLLLSLLPCSNAYCMEPSLPTGGWVYSWSERLAIIGGALLGVIGINTLLQEPQTFTYFEKLLPELRLYIINLITTGATSNDLIVAGNAINTLALVNKDLNELINDPQYSNKLIKSLAQRFNASEADVCNAIQTVGAKEYLKVNIKNAAGYTPLMHAVWATNLDNLLDLLGNPYIIIDEQNNHGETALMMAMNNLEQIKNLPDPIDRENRSKRLRILCGHLLLAGANPNIANVWGITPLQKACQLNDIQTVTAMEKTIKKRQTIRQEQQ